MSSSTLRQRGVRERVRKTWIRRGRGGDAKEVDNVAARRREKVSIYRASPETTSPTSAADDTSNIIHERGEESHPHAHTHVASVRFVFLSTSLPRATSLNGDAGSPRAPSRLLPVAHSNVYYLSTVTARYHPIPRSIAVAPMLTHSDLKPPCL